MILWLLEELDIDYNLNLFERETSGANKNRAPASLKKSHPLGKSPQLITPEGRLLIERAAIAKYLIDKYDTIGKFKLNPDDPVNDAIREEELISFGGNSLSPILTVKMVFKFVTEGSPFFFRPIVGSISAMVNKAFLNQEIDNMMRYLDNDMKGKSYFMNTENPTRVDFMNLWFIDMCSLAGVNDLAKYSNLQAFSQRCKERDAWKRSLEKGNGYDMNITM